MKMGQIYGGFGLFTMPFTTTEQALGAIADLIIVA